MTTITFAVDGPEWDSLYENPENHEGPHGIHEGVSIEAQLILWPKIILHHWNKHTSVDELSYLGFDPGKPPPERSLVSLKAGSNLYLVSGIARQIARRPWSTNPAKQRIDTLLDCGLPIVISEHVKGEERSTYVENEGEFLVLLCFLFGSIAFSGVMFRTPITGKVKKVGPLSIVPLAVLLEVELQRPPALPEFRVSYHSEQVRTVGADRFRKDLGTKRSPEKSLY
jgi:hypothetical protein